MGLLPTKTPILYIGIQDGLVKIPLDSRKTHHVDSFRDKYVTSFYTAPDNQRMLISTLNDGLWTDNGNGPQRAFARQQLSPRLTAVIDTYPPATLMATNDNIFLQGGRDTIRVEGTSALLPANDSIVYALLERGVMKIRVKGQRLKTVATFFRDIKFHSQASLFCNGRLYLGSDLGVLSFKPNKERQAEWIPMETSVITRRNLLEGSAIMVGTLLLIYLFLLRARRSNNQELKARQRDLTRRLDAVKSFMTILSDEDKQEARDLQQAIQSLALRKHHSWRVSNHLFFRNIFFHPDLHLAIFMNQLFQRFCKPYIIFSGTLRWTFYMVSFFRISCLLC